MSNHKYISGVHIQWPWSQLILTEKKTIETRGYALPKKHIGKSLALIETPGQSGKNAGVKQSRIVGVVTFSGCFRYASKEDWKGDYSKHLVSDNDQQFGFTNTKQKWGWIISSVSILKKPIAPPKKRGIVFANNCRI